jgi:hypothetical protein
MPLLTLMGKLAKCFGCRSKSDIGLRFLNSLYAIVNRPIYCSIANPTYNKKAALAQDKQKGLKLQRVGEAVFKDNKWQINDEKVCRQ